MKNTVFLTFSMMIVTLLILAHALFRETLSPVNRLEVKVEQLEKQKRESDFHAQLAQSRLADYQQDVATLLPSVLNSKTADDAKSYPLRQMASVVTEPDGFAMERASGLMEKGKELFRDHDYEKSSRIFNQVINKYPDSAHLPEAFFLRAESQYMTKDFEAAIVSIEKMVDVFPDNELTGYALLRLGNIFEAQDRLEDASDIYRALIANFRQAEIQKQASLSLKSVAL